MAKTLNDLSLGAMFADKETPNLILRVGGRDLPGYPAPLASPTTSSAGCFDAREPKNPDRNRANWGNNHYPTSNAHQWLNSEENDWFKPQHDHDAPPSLTTSSTATTLRQHPGFLARFSRAFRDGLTEADIKTRNAKTGDTETIKAKVWLLSATEVGFDTDGTEGVLLPIFADFRMKIAAPNAEAVETASYQPGGFNPTEGWPYLLRSPDAANSYIVRRVNSDGTEGRGNAYNGDLGLRPALLLKSEISVSDEPDERGVYILG
jgi:hypothetical protein